ncbi:MAG: 4-hydroxy-tetrahydrodipicolinate synthase [Planctomycetes bacterium]|nr:4-hydroxy-tetrahydrodipicolinate synthase [Planctomycetota bacterium]
MLHGVFTALVTPFRDHGVDYDAFERLIEEQIAAGVHGLVPCGTTGESSTLSVEEHDEVVRFTVESVRGRVPVVAGTGSNSTAEAVARTQHAREVGADAVLQVMPYYNRPGQEGLFRHISAVARVGVPIVLYNIPSRSAVALTFETYQRLAALPEVVGTKEATGSLDMAERLLSDGRLRVLSGDDALTFPILCVGGHGVVSVASNVIPRFMVDLYELTVDGQWAEARQKHLQLVPIVEALFREGNPGPIKSALADRGKIEDILRLPMTSATPETRGLLRRRLQDLS